MEISLVITEFNRHMQAMGYAPKTIELYRYGLNLFRKWVQGKQIGDLRKITHKTILDYQASVNKKGGAVETKAIKMRAVKRLFEYLVSANRLLINPTEGIIETNRKNRAVGTTLTISEMAVLLNQPNLSLPAQIRDRAIMEVLYSTAIRSDELLNLHVYDVDLKDKVLFVRKGKGRRQRVVPFGKSAGQYLKEYLEKIRPLHVKKNPKERLLFISAYGKPLTWNAVMTRLSDYRKQAGIEKPIGVHVFRRSCATHMLQQGADIRYIQKLLGHRYIKTTQAYTKVIPVDVKTTHKKTHPNAQKETRRNDD